MSDYGDNHWEGVNASQHAPTCYQSPIDRDQIMSSPQDFQDAYNAWYLQYLVDPATAERPPQPYAGRLQSPIQIQPPPTPCDYGYSPMQHVYSSVPRAGTMPHSSPPRVNLPSQIQTPTRGLFAPTTPQVQHRPDVKIGKSITAKPQPFNGDKTIYPHWWCTVKHYLRGYENEPSDHQKILIVLSYMTGQNAAGRWADLYESQNLGVIHTFDEFTTMLKKTFQPVDAK